MPHTASPPRAHPTRSAGPAEDFWPAGLGCRKASLLLLPRRRGGGHTQEGPFCPGLPLNPALPCVSGRPSLGGQPPALAAGCRRGHLGRRPEAAPALLGPRRPRFCVFVCFLPLLLRLPRTLRFSLPETGLSSRPALSRGERSAPPLAKLDQHASLTLEPGSGSAHRWTRHICEASALLITQCSQPGKASHPGPLAPQNHKGEPRCVQRQRPGAGLAPRFLLWSPRSPPAPLQMGPSLLLIRNLCACVQSSAHELPTHPNEEGLTHRQA